MNAAATQITEQYETLGLTPEQIAEQEGLEIGVIKAILIQSSPKYRGEMNVAVKKGYTDSDLDQAYEVVRRTAFYSDDEHLAYKAAESIIDEKNGRKDVVRQLQQHPPINALVFNIQLQKAAEAINRAKGAIVDVVSEAVNGKVHST